MVNSGFFSEEELYEMGLKSFGSNVLISKKVSIYNPQSMSIGNNVRIDDYTIITGSINIGNYVHIGAHCLLYGGMGITFEDFSGISGRVSVYSMTDDYSGSFLQNPMVPSKYRQITGGPVIFRKYANVGVGTIILPNVELKEGAAVGAGCLITKNLKEWTLTYQSNKIVSIPRDRKMKEYGEELTRKADK